METPISTRKPAKKHRYDPFEGKTEAEKLDLLINGDFSEIEEIGVIEGIPDLNSSTAFRPEFYKNFYISQKSEIASAPTFKEVFNFSDFQAAISGNDSRTCRTPKRPLPRTSCLVYAYFPMFPQLHNPSPTTEYCFQCYKPVPMTVLEKSSEFCQCVISV